MINQEPSSIDEENNAQEEPDDLFDDPQNAAIFAATFRQLPSIQQIERRWKEQGLAADDPVRLDLDLHACFDRRLEIIAGAIIAAFRKHSERFASVHEGYAELTDQINGCIQESKDLRQELERFVSSARVVANAHHELAKAQQASTDRIAEAVKVCRERSVPLVILQGMIPMMTLVFGIVATLLIEFLLKKP